MKKIKWLCVVLIVLNLLDVWTTYMALSVGATEANPIARVLIESNTLWIVKFFVPLFACMIIYYGVIETPKMKTYATKALVMLNIYFAVIVAWNTFNYVFIMSL
jgi:hypothetical protein